MSSLSLLKSNIRTNWLRALNSGLNITAHAQCNAFWIVFLICFIIIIPLCLYECSHMCSEFLNGNPLLMLAFLSASPGLPAAPVLLHCRASVRLLLWTGLVRQAGRRGVHQVPDGATASDLGAPEPADVSQGPSLCDDGPHGRGEAADELATDL